LTFLVIFVSLPLKEVQSFLPFWINWGIIALKMSSKKEIVFVFLAF